MFFFISLCFARTRPAYINTYNCNKDKFLKWLTKDLYRKISSGKCYGKFFSISISHGKFRLSNSVFVTIFLSASFTLITPFDLLYHNTPCLYVTRTKLFAKELYRKVLVGNLIEFFPFYFSCKFSSLKQCMVDKYTLHNLIDHDYYYMSVPAGFRRSDQSKPLIWDFWLM